MAAVSKDDGKLRARGHGSEEDSGPEQCLSVDEPQFSGRIFAGGIAPSLEKLKLIALFLYEYTFPPLGVEMPVVFPMTLDPIRGP
jgi:hypothetical protein